MAGRTIDIGFAILLAYSGLLIAALGAAGFVVAVSHNSIVFSVVGMTLSAPLVATGLWCIFALPREILQEEHTDDRPELGESR